MKRCLKEYVVVKRFNLKTIGVLAIALVGIVLSVACSSKNADKKAPLTIETDVGDYLTESSPSS